eukprot:CAMPEP_0171962088 /NCGR_PEP_ID=MMETSP0993-20121228/166863_1 /TAXON_ID=483369 /ORGANISM="non described non described, Strain CCMP2098" /LENGTH=75 /DNA_ID=CAMNT_0012610329 /DNA_START=30 /DNA_END=257 /DNA_ORIENTATION=+
MAFSRFFSSLARSLRTLGKMPGPGKAVKGPTLVAEFLAAFCCTLSKKPAIHMESSSAGLLGPGRIRSSLGYVTLS